MPARATYPQPRRAGSTAAYLVLLRVEIARFTRTESARLCCSDPHLTVDRCYLLRRSLESGRSSDRLRGRRSPGGLCGGERSSCGGPHPAPLSRVRERGAIQLRRLSATADRRTGVDRRLPFSCIVKRSTKQPSEYSERKPVARAVAVAALDPDAVPA